MEDKKWCPQHGFPLPCDKCGMPLTQQKEIYKAGQREVVEWIQSSWDTVYIYDGQITHYGSPHDNQFKCDLGDWQAKLKEWGL